MNKGNKKFSKGKNIDRIVDLSKQDDFLFNKTPILSSALQKLKNKGSKPKPINRPKLTNLSNNDNGQMQGQPKKKIKKTLQEMIPSLIYTPLQKDLYSFYTINKTTLTNMDMIQEPKFDVGSLVLTAICDRGIGGKYLVTNLFRNKKCYIDYKEISHTKGGKDEFEGIQAYWQPGDFVIGNVVKSRNPPHLQLSLINFPQIDVKSLRVGQIIPATIKSKQELGCILQADMCKGFKVFLPKSYNSDEQFDHLQVKRQIITVIKQIDSSKLLLKVTLPFQEQISLNLQGVEEQQMKKLQLDQYVYPGTLLNTKIIKVLKNGIVVKFLKIFAGFIHSDHLQKSLKQYSKDDKLLARVIFLCANPPVIYLSQKHVDLTPYQPCRELYEDLEKPKSIQECQGSYLCKSQQFFAHPSQLPSEFDNVGKFWVKENNYFEKYQIMTGRKVGLKVGEISKTVPFTNFKIIGEGQGKKFRVMCLDVWSKVVKISYDEKVLKSKNMLYNADEIEEEKQYCGFVKSLVQNGVIIQFCNNIKGIIPLNELKINEISFTQENKGEGIEIYVASSKKNLLTLSFVPPNLRKKKNKSKEQEQYKGQEQTMSGIIQSIDVNSINPIYVKIKHNKVVKISVFAGIKPAALASLPIIQNLNENYEIGQKVIVFRKKQQYSLYPPEQLNDKQLRVCRVVSKHQSYVRLQLGKNEFRNCHICQITDLIVPFPLSQVKVGDYQIGRVLPNKTISLRSSIVTNGIPKNMKDCLALYKEDEKRGDYRNRILTIGSSGLKEDMVVFGYVKAFSQKGCFVSLTSDYSVRIQMCELTDEYVQDKSKLYPPNKLILCRLISEKVKKSEINNHLFDASARQSIVKTGYPINDEALMSGLTVSGIVTGYVKGKALIKIDGSKYTGIMHPNDVQGSQRDQPVEKVMKIGNRYKMKITQYNNDGKRLIRLSTLTKYFNKYKGVQLEYEENPNIVNLWQNYKKLLKEEPPASQQIMLQDNEEDDYLRMKDLLEKQLDSQMDQQQPEDDESDDKEQDHQMEEQQALLQQKMEEQDEQEDQKEQQSEQDKGDTDNKEQIMKRLSQFRKMEHEAPVYQSIVLANDSSESHIQYISAMVNDENITPQQIRDQFTRSINMLSNIKDKQNMWVAWLNMELILGGFKNTVEKAIKAGVGLPVYNRIIQIFREKENWDLGYEFAKKMLKKFNKDFKAYVSYQKHIVVQSIQTSSPERTSIKQLLRRASQCLKKPQVIMLQTQYGKILYEEKQIQKARTVFGELTARLPKRIDIWCMYVDLELKHGHVERGRQILERGLTLELKKKKIVSLLNKYYEIQKNHGTEKSRKELQIRAKAIAEKYADKEEDGSDIDDE